MAENTLALSTRNFRDVVSIAQMAVERRTTIPILSMLRCKANGSFEMSGTDLDVMLTAKVDHGGGPKAEFILAEPAIVARAVAAGGTDRVCLSHADGSVVLSSGPLELKVGNSLAADDFPADVADMAVETFTTTLSHAQIRSLSRVAGAVSTEETRYYLNGVFVHHLEGSTYRAVATDGHRLCYHDLELPDAAGTLPGIIIPRKALRLLLTLASKASPSDDGVTLTVGNRNAPNRETTTAPERLGTATRAKVSLTIGKVSVSLATKLIDGTFPDYSRVVPAAQGSTFLFQRDELRRAVEAVSAGARQPRAVRLQFDNDGALISSRFVDVGVDTTFRIACTHDRPGFDVGFNGAYLLSMLDAAGAGEFVINTVDQASPALIKNPADTAWTGLLMPMRL